MFITLIDSRTLAAGLYHGPSDTFFNFTSGKWETPFAGTSHTRAFTPSVALPGIINCNLGFEAYAKPNIVGTIFAFDPASSTYTPIDMSSPSNARNEPCTGSTT